MSNKPEKLGEYKVHPVAAMFPLVEGDAFTELVASIKKNGLQEPIVLAPDGLSIADGRNRFRACKAAGIKPEIRKLPKSFDESKIIQFIIDANLHRRHLNAGQRAMLGLQLAPYLETAAKERQAAGRKAGASKGGRGKKKPENRAPQVRDQIAAAVGVDPTTVSQSKKVRDARGSVPQNQRRAGQVALA
jgi:hypothetical protein